jgi:hypothetical protein
MRNGEVLVMIFLETTDKMKDLIMNKTLADTLSSMYSIQSAEDFSKTKIGWRKVSPNAEITPTPPLLLAGAKHWDQNGFDSMHTVLSQQSGPVTVRCAPHYFPYPTLFSDVSSPPPFPTTRLGDVSSYRCALLDAPHSFPLLPRS